MPSPTKTSDESGCGATIRSSSMRFCARASQGRWDNVEQRHQDDTGHEAPILVTASPVSARPQVCHVADATSCCAAIARRRDKAHNDVELLQDQMRRQ